jgi:hypothetical protein
MVGHVRKGRPWHDLEKITVHFILVWRLGRIEDDRSGRNAIRRAAILNVCQLRGCTGRMNVVEISAVPYDLLELGKRVTAYGPPILVRCQISADDGWTCILVRPGRSPDYPECAEVGASSQVDCRIDLCQLAKVWVFACNEGIKAKRRRAAAVATIAVSYRIDQVAAKPHQIPVLAGQIQVDRRYFETFIDERRLVIVRGVLRLHAWRTTEYSQEKNRPQCYDGPDRQFGNPLRLHLRFSPSSKLAEFRTLTRIQGGMPQVTRAGYYLATLP